MPEGAATRLGWAQEYANLQAPLGFDKFGYSWRSRKGTRFNEAFGKKYSPSYGEGDTLGFLIVLPENLPNYDYMPNTFKDRVSGVMVLPVSVSLIYFSDRFSAAISES